MLEKNATYLITGGMGGVGMSVARWLADRGAGNIVLTGRRSPSPETGETNRRAAGIRCPSPRDYGGFDQRYLHCGPDRRDGRMPGLRGIFHAAAVVDDVLLTALTPEQISRVLAPKWRERGIFTVIQRGSRWISSSCVFYCCADDQPGQAAYAAGNSFLDAFAAYRQSRASGHQYSMGRLGGYGPSVKRGYPAKCRQLRVARRSAAERAARP